jgi:hypothetical protein
MSDAYVSQTTIEAVIDRLDRLTPAEIRYVFAALTDDDPSDAVRLTDEEFWHLLAVLKTVVETLHEVSEPAR